MPLVVAIPAAFPVVKAAIVGFGSITLGAVALFLGKRQRVSEPPRSSQPKNSQTPPTAASLPSTLIARGRAALQRVRTRAGKVVCETVRATVERIKGYTQRVRTIPCKIAKATITHRLGLVLQQLGIVQSLDVKGLLKGFLKSPPRTRAPSC